MPSPSRVGEASMSTPACRSSAVGARFEHAQEDFVDELAVVRRRRFELGQLAVGVVDRVGERRAAEQRHHGAELQLARCARIRSRFRGPGGRASRASRFRVRSSNRAAPPPACPAARRGACDAEPVDAMDGVVQHLGRQPAGQGVRVVEPVVFVPVVGLVRKLVGPRLADRADELPHVEVAGDELVGEVVEQLGVGRRVAGADVVDRLDDADAGQVAPEAVDVAAGEVRVVAAR